MTRQAPSLNIEVLYCQYGGMVLRRVRRFYRGDEAEDVLQEVFMRVIDKIDSFRGESSPVTWLYQLTTRYCLNRLRNEGRRKELWLEQADSIYWSQPVSSASQEQRTLVNQLWKHIDEELVTVGIYYYLDGMTHAEIARIMGCSRRTVGNRLEALQQQAREAGGVQ